MIVPYAFLRYLSQEHAHLVGQRHPLFSRHGAQNFKLAGPRLRGCIGDRHGEMLARIPAGR